MKGKEGVTFEVTIKCQRNFFCNRVQSTDPPEYIEMPYKRSDIEKLKGCFMQSRSSEQVH